MSSSITTQHLETFVTVEQEGSFSAAAMALDIAQPTISGRVKALEDAVGGPLFVRGGRRVVLTRRGAAFLAHAKRALDAVEDGLLAARGGDRGQAGRLTIGVTDSALADSFLGAAVARFSAQYPGVEVFASMSSCGQNVKALHAGTVQLAFVSWPYASPAFDLLVPLLRLRERLAVVASPRHPLAGATLTMAEVLREARPFLSLWWNQSSARALAGLADTADVPVEIPIPAARHALLRGEGVALFAPSVIAHELETGALVRLDVTDLPEVATESALAVHRDRAELSSVARAFVDVVRVQAGPLVFRSLSQRPLVALAAS
jgi:DNA-binding transcriptional LysR family regulator